MCACYGTRYLYFQGQYMHIDLGAYCGQRKVCHTRTFTYVFESVPPAKTCLVLFFFSFFFPSCLASLLSCICSGALPLLHLLTSQQDSLLRHNSKKTRDWGKNEDVNTSQTQPTNLLRWHTVNTSTDQWRINEAKIKARESLMKRKCKVCPDTKN